MIHPKFNWIIATAAGAGIAWFRGKSVVAGAFWGFVAGLVVHVLASWKEIFKS